MQFRNFDQDTKISALGFGFMRLPLIDGKEKNINMDKTEQLFLQAIQQGINYFDTAYVYHDEYSEQALGALVKKYTLRDKIYIADKLPAFSIPDDYDPYTLFETSLKRLQTDYIDFYLLHNMNLKRFETLKQKGIFEFMDTIKKEKKVHRMGFSFHDRYENFVEILNSYPWDFCQIQLNFMDTDYQAGIKGLELAAKKGIPVIIMEPLKGGQLTNSDAYIEKLKEKYNLENEKIAKIALDFLFNRKEILTVLSGMNESMQIKENTQTASSMYPGEMPENEKLFLQDLKEYYRKKDLIPCTGCGYCIKNCPQHIEIPEVFERYNNALMYGNIEFNRKQYDEFYSTKECIACEECMKNCPQHLPIPHLFDKVYQYLHKK